MSDDVNIVMRDQYSIVYNRADDKRGGEYFVYCNRGDEGDGGLK